MTLVDVRTAGQLPKDQALRAAAAVEAVRSLAVAHNEVALDQWLFELEPSGYLALLEQLAEDPLVEDAR